MSNVMQNQIDYLPTETELRQILGSALPDQFVRDYVAIKRNVSNASQQTDINSGTIQSLTIRVGALEVQVLSINNQITVINGQITTIQSDLSDLDTLTTNHIAAESAHGAAGNIVGTDDYAQPATGGTVQLAAAVTDSVASAISPPAAVGAAGVVYLQAYAQGQTDAINALSLQLASLRDSYNSLVTQFNSSLSTERTAKQRAV